MAKYNLEPNESILIQHTGVLRETGSLLMKPFTDELILTTKNIIWISKGMFGNTKGVHKYPLNQVKVINGEVQTFVRKGSAGKPNLNVYFINGQEVFQFQNTSKREIAKWVNEISKVLTGHDSTRGSGAYQSAIPGTEYLAETLKDTVGVFKNALGIKSKGETAAVTEKVTKKCIGCMAPLTGTKGQSVLCKYCDTVQIL
ncbi:PH domain-containing protein [Bacillus sp. es.034]|uniref:PH domain-containing protein n=1 Tax=Bacillus sp. es.034 TaxID=1761763 RepID=UPI000C0011EA|nr:PH domain-containing protein [Bacillus sp. es.034]PFG05241.1 hypothetical protein ATG71_2068 [Bacillus sp. es.034]